MTYLCTCNFKFFFILVFHVDAELGKSHYIDNNINAIVHEWKQNNWERLK